MTNGSAPAMKLAGADLIRKIVSVNYGKLGDIWG